jgi:hypothetical protein
MINAIDSEIPIDPGTLRDLKKSADASSLSSRFILTNAIRVSRADRQASPTTRAARINISSLKLTSGARRYEQDIAKPKMKTLPQ